MTVLLSGVLLLTAAAYASVGLGGGSSYLAILSFWSHDPDQIRPLSWGLNVVAAGVGSIIYHRSGHMSWRLSIPILIGGVVGAAIGARMPISAAAFRWLLAAALLAIAIRMFWGKKQRMTAAPKLSDSWWTRLAIGVAVGIPSGMVGIGGGILLGPLLVSLAVADTKIAAATTSLYVMLSSAAALSAHVAGGGLVDGQRLAVYGLVCMLGAFVGSRYGALKAKPRHLELIFACLILIAAVRLVLIRR
ncbi:MAG: sulfite exporter TauE/SafE family protein [Candidatus Zixiibacteriota bacterium]